MELYAVMGIVFAAIFVVLALMASGRKTSKYRPPPDMPEPDERFEIVPLDPTIVRYGCGHDHWKSYEGRFYGLRRASSDAPPQDRECADCTLKMAKKAVIRCAICGHYIQAGDPVAVFASGTHNEGWATRLPEGIVCCLRWGCEGSPGFIGHWRSDGTLAHYFVDKAGNDGSEHAAESKT